MFQFNENDLDFGIYKIYNLKRKHIESFIEGDGENDLAPTIEQIMKEVNLQTQKADAIDLYNFLKGKNMENLLNDPEANYEDIQLALNFEKDEDKKESLTQTLNNLSKAEGLTDELKDKIYNHILGFFQMYYSNGDFGYNDRSRDLYKVPYEADYNGSDTMFHWKHKGSLYIKTGTSFNAIKFDLNGKKIEYRLETNVHSEEEGTSQNNNKDSQLKHYRFDRIDKVKDKATNETIYQVIFNLSDASTSKVEIYKQIYKEISNVTDIEKYLQYEKDGKTKQVFVDLTKDFDKVQNGQIKGLSALRQNKLKVEKEVKNNFDRGVRLYDEGTKEFTDATLKDLYSLDQKLNSFYIGNDADYFIHENLNEFLTNEKNRFVKNYIFDDLESIYNGKLDNTTLLIAKAFDKVSSRIIEFLSAIEDFQKHLFTKKKKVIESEYCITVDYIDEKYYEEILKNPAQLEEWENLFSLKVKTVEDLKANPTLVLDTKCFRQPDGTNLFKDKLLSELEDLDENINGLLINSENHQALDLLQTKFKEKIKTIYIDPPYNTGGDEGFLYKDNFQHSSWSSFMIDRLKKAKKLTSKEGTIAVSIDINELDNTIKLLDIAFGIDNRKNIISIRRSSVSGAKVINPGVVNIAEYIIIYAIDSTHWKPNRVFKEKERDVRYNNYIINRDDHYEKWEYCSVLDAFAEFKQIQKSKLRKELGDEYNKELDKFIYSNSEKIIQFASLDESSVSDAAKEIKRISKDDPNKTYCLERKGKDNYYLLKGKVILFFESRLITVNGEKKYGALISDMWSDVLPNDLHNEGGVKLRKGKKPEKLVGRVLELGSNEEDYVIDYFSGSGTTGGAALKTNRKFINIEMGTYFNTLTLPRIKNTLWGEQKGISKQTGWKGSGIVKYQAIEQYEDVLDNLQEYAGELPENLPLKYLYKPEENSLETTLDLFAPFNNKISYGQPTQQGFIDMVETYNYLQGYFIKSIKTYELNKKYYKAVETTIGVLVIWRDIAIDEDDSKQIIELALKYPNIHTIEVNAEFATLQLDKGNHLKVKDTDIELKIITKEVFNQ